MLELSGLRHIVVILACHILTICHAPSGLIQMLKVLFGNTSWCAVPSLESYPDTEGLRDLNSDWKNPLLLCSGNDCLVSSCMWPSTLHPLSHVAKYNTILPLPNGLKLLWTALNEAILHYCTFAWCQRAPCASGWKPLGCDKTLVSDSLHVRTRRTWDKMGRAPE